MEAKKKIRFGSALPGPGLGDSTPTYDYSPLIGKHVALEGSGEEVLFEKNLPRRAKIIRQLNLNDWGSDWLLLHFEKPFRHERDLIVDCLVRARWLGHPVGSEFCPVFVLIDRHGVLKNKKEWGGADFDFVTWGEVRVEGHLDPRH